jgi:uncharacterized protein YbjT (DUF2867 family)
MQVAVVGGTGVCGSCVVDELRHRGHQPRVLSRRPSNSVDHYQVDLSTGDGLSTALTGADAVIDASNTRKRRIMRAVLVDGTERLLRAEAEAGVAHHVLPSIVGIDAVPMAYYRIKLEQEQAVLRGPVHATVVRSTQFHQLVDEIFSATARLGFLPRSGIALQPIDPREAAVALVDAVERGPGDRVEVAGPEILTVTELARAWMRAVPRRRPLVPIPLPGKFGRALRAGALTGPSVRYGTGTFSEWLRADRTAGPS